MCAGCMFMYVRVRAYLCVCPRARAHVVCICAGMYMCVLVRWCVHACRGVCACVYICMRALGLG